MAKADDLGVDNVLDTITTLFGLDGEHRGDEYKIHCPNPKHDDHEPSCDVNLKTGYWNCLACAQGGDLLDLGKLTLGISQREVAARLRPSTPEALISMLQSKLGRIKVSDRVRKHTKLELPGPYHPEPLDEMYERGFTHHTMQRWGVRYVGEQELIGQSGEPFTIRNSIAIPIRDDSGRLLAWCYRSTKDSQAWQPRYLYTPGFPISEVWFGLQHHASAEHITVVEGAADAMWLDQCGFPALALLGSQMGNRKIMRLQHHRSVTLFADRDDAGAKWVQRIGADLGGRTQVYVVLYDKRIVRTYIDPNEKDRKKRKLDPQMLAPLDVELLIDGRMPWSTFVRRTAAS